MAVNPYALQNLTQVTSSGTTAIPQLQSGASIVGGNLSSFSDPNSEYMQNARRQGLELAAQRGGINSSIAAGASQRSALEAALPLVNQASAIDQANQQTTAEDWLNTQNFNRSLYGQMATSSFNSTLDMLAAVQQMSLTDPELYTPEVASGLSNFFSRNMADTLQRYFGG